MKTPSEDLAQFVTDKVLYEGIKKVTIRSYYSRDRFVPVEWYVGDCGELVIEVTFANVAETSTKPVPALQLAPL